MSDFNSLPLPTALLRAVEVLGFTELTPVQRQALPPALTGRDVIGQARTGSGKTAAFALPLLARLDVRAASMQALVLCPTRELAEQVSAEIRRLGRFVPNLRVVTLCGGVPARSQLPALAHTPHVVVGTPGRVLDHLERDTLKLHETRVLVLDEADRMLDMGFAEDIQAIIDRVPQDRQTLLFSATWPDDIRAMSRRVQRSPVEVTVAPGDDRGEIVQLFFEVEATRKLDAVAALLLHHRPESALVFCHTKNDVRLVAEALAARGFAVLALHGDLEQRERDEVLIRFSNRSANVLVATDVAARGLDIKGLDAVLSFELPNDPDIHVHRIGRTGRAGHKGLALSLVSPGERKRSAAIEARLGASLRWGKLRLDDNPDARAPAAPMLTLLIDGGKKDKLRPGDVLGALTGDAGLAVDVVGKIVVLPERTYVAVVAEHAERARAGLRRVKNKTFRVWLL